MFMLQWRLTATGYTECASCGHRTGRSHSLEHSEGRGETSSLSLPGPAAQTPDSESCPLGNQVPRKKILLDPTGTPVYGGMARSQGADGMQEAEYEERHRPALRGGARKGIQK